MSNNARIITPFPTAIFTITIIASVLFTLAAPFSPLFSPLAHAETIEERERRLRAELERIEREQAETQKILDTTQAQSASLQRDITLLNAKIKAAQLEIQKKNLVISGLGKDITTKTQKINSLTSRIETGRESLAQLMRKANEIESYTLPEILLAHDSLNTLATDIDNFEAIRSSLKDVFFQVKEAKTLTEAERTVLDKKKNQETDARKVIESEKKSIETNEKEKKRLLSVTKGQEQEYQKVLAEKRQKAAEIRAALFSLRDTAAIPFGQAFEYANLASKKTGIRPAFLLAILTQESALGKNVGSCYLTNPTTGSGVSIKSGSAITNVMKPGRDVEPFISITEELGFDPYKTLVSCPQSIGWGGAMGPAQFIPSTWQLFKVRIANAVGVKVPNPWRAQDAFMASAIYLSDLGANSQSYTSERNAACRYYSGSSCVAGSINMIYGEQVMYKAQTIQTTMIDPLQGV
jgi:peptidoglycan hydrolase CwlO-like protein